LRNAAERARAFWKGESLIQNGGAIGDVRGSGERIAISAAAWFSISSNGISSVAGDGTPRDAVACPNTRA